MMPSRRGYSERPARLPQGEALEAAQMPHERVLAQVEDGRGARHPGHQRERSTIHSPAPE